MKKLIGAAVVVCVIFLFSAVLISFAQADWGMFRADSSHVGVGTGNLALKPTLLWNYTTRGNVESSASVVGGVVYLGSNDHNVYALNAATGAKLWNYTTGAEVESSPAVVDGIVYMGGQTTVTYTLWTLLLAQNSGITMLALVVM